LIQTVMADAMENLIPVALIEDDAPYRAYIAALLESTGRMRVTAQGGTANAGLTAAMARRPRILLLDLHLPDRAGETIIAPLLAALPDLKIVVLSGHDGDDAVLAAIRAGACGYLLKGASSADVIDAVEDALCGGAPMSPSIARKVMQLLRSASVEARAADGLAVLTPREREVLELVANGSSDKEVAAALNLSRSTVKNVLQAVYGKWRVRTRTEAAAKFFRRNGA
jgi:DNA-binding NarL/FixJ family response regulator